jgi:type VI secretion system secreted protein Hcp
MAMDAFLKLEGIIGESQKMNHSGEIEVSNFHLQAINPTTVKQGTGLSATKVSLSGFTVTRPTDKASPSIFVRCCAGEHFGKASVALQKATGDTTGEIYLRYDFKKVFLTDIAWADNGEDTPTERLTFAYEEIKISYKPQASDGGLRPQIVGGWNQALNARV